jgi:hypothetical protein
MSTNIVYNGNSLQTATIVTAQPEGIYDIPTRDAKQYILSNFDQSRIPFINHTGRTIKLNGVLIGTSVNNLDSLIDTFRSYLNGQDLNLDIDWAGGTRRFIATVNSTTITRPGGLLHANFMLEFVCNYPFGQDTTATTAISAAGRTLSAYSDAYTFGGTAPYQLTVVTYTLTAVTGGVNQTITFGNGANGQAISVNRTWFAGDVIDSTANTVTANGNLVSFYGAFPQFPPGSGTLQYSDTFATRTFTILTTLIVRYL